MNKILFCILLLSASALASPYYVDPVSGNDANDGKSQEEAFEHFYKALESIDGQDVVYMMDGEHDAYIDSAKSLWSGLEWSGGSLTETLSDSDPNWNVVKPLPSHSPVLYRFGLSAPDGSVHRVQCKFQDLTIGNSNTNAHFHLYNVAALRFTDCEFTGDGSSAWDTSYGGVPMENSGDIEFSSCKIWKNPYLSDRHLISIFRGTSNITFDDCEIFSVVGNDAMRIDATDAQGADVCDIVVTDCHFHDIWHDADGGGHEDAIQMYQGSGNPPFTYNFYDCQFKRNLVTRNWHQGFMLRGFNTIVENNVFTDEPEGNMTDALGCNYFRGDARCMNNTVDGVLSISDGSSQRHYCDSFEFFNNVMTTWQNDANESEYETVSHNLYSSIGDSDHDPTGYGSNNYQYSTITDLRTDNFTDYAQADYTLVADACAINYGTDVNAPTDDKLGNARDSSPDAGAYEYGGSLPEPGQAYSPSPYDGRTDVNINSQLIWKSGGNTDNYDVYFGTNPDPDASAMQVNKSDPNYDPGTLEYGRTYYWQVDANNANPGVTQGDRWLFTTIEQAYDPCKPVSPSPANGVTGVSINFDGLDWQNGGLATSYDLYFGTSSTPNSIDPCASDLLASEYTALDTLGYGTHYYWQVYAKNANGVTAGDVWDFYTEGSGTPEQATNYYPKYGAINVPADAIFTWDDGATDPSAEATSYEIYFGTESPGDYQEDVTVEQYDPGGLQYNTTYYWMVYPKNSAGKTAGSAYNFTTEPRSQSRISPFSRMRRFWPY